MHVIIPFDCTNIYRELCETYYFANHSVGTLKKRPEYIKKYFI